MTNQIGRHRRQPIAVVLGPTVFNGQVLTLDVAGFFQPLPKPRDTKGIGLGRTRAQIADHCPRAITGQAAAPPSSFDHVGSHLHD